MPNTIVLNRRSIRIKAMQSLYAFYVSEKANQKVAFDQIQHLISKQLIKEEKGVIEESKEKANATLGAYFAEERSKRKLPPLNNQYVKEALEESVAWYKKAEQKDLWKLEKTLTDEGEVLHQCYLLIFHLLLCWKRVAEEKLEKQTLYGAHGQAPQPTLFIENRVMNILEATTPFNDPDHPLAHQWAEHADIINVSYEKGMLKEPAFLEYCNQKESTWTQDIDLLIALIKRVIAKHPSIDSFFGEIDSSWKENKALVVQACVKVLEEMREDSEKKLNFTNSELKQTWSEGSCWYVDLVRKVIEQREVLDQLVASKSDNWDFSRIALIDKIVLNLALVEIFHFHEIPTKVTIDEYITIVKKYSTPKSSRFINGLLDAIATESE